MKTLSQILGILVLTIVATGCGESFEGVYYTDQAKVTANSCTNDYGIYEMELNVRVEGDQLRFQIMSLRTPGGGGSAAIEARLVGAAISTSFQGSNEFGIENATFSNLDVQKHYVTAGGTLSLGKEMMTNFNMNLTTTRPTSSSNLTPVSCQMNLYAPRLDLRQRQ